MSNKMEKADKKIEELLKLKDLAGKKIHVQYLFSNDEIGNQCIIVVTDLNDNTDISDILSKLTRKRMVKVQNKIVSMLHRVKDDKLRGELTEDLDTLDWFTIKEEELQIRGYKKNTENKCKCFILRITPDLRIEFGRMDTEEAININNISDLFDVLNDEKYNFVY